MDALAIPQHIRCPKCSCPMWYYEWDMTFKCATSDCELYNKAYTAEFSTIVLTEVPKT